MQIEIRTLQISKSSWAHEVVSSYEKKITHFNPIDFKMIRVEKDFLRGVGPKDFVVVCDERGESFSSKKFAQQVKMIIESGKQKCIFLVGGPFGLPAEIKARANLKISLSHFVFNQELALIVLFEQVFRAFTIMNNHPYHND